MPKTSLSPRNRNWFLTINPSAECYSHYEDILKNLMGKNDHYAYSVHDKDTDTEGKPKTKHIHLVLMFSNARSFTAVRKIFKGAHIEPSLNKRKSVQYLIHLNDKTKYQYARSTIQSDDSLSINKMLEENETYNAELLPYYVLIEGTHTYLDLVMRFGHLSVSVAKEANQILADYNALPDEEKKRINKKLTEAHSDLLPF